MPLLPSIFRAARSVQTTSEGNSPTASLYEPRGSHTPQRSKTPEWDSSPAKVTDYVSATRPLPPTPETGPAKAQATAQGLVSPENSMKTPPRHPIRSSPHPSPTKVALDRLNRRAEPSPLNPSRSSPSSSPARHQQSPMKTPPSVRRRPAELKLRTSNLTPPPESPTPSKSKVAKVLWFIPEESTASTPTNAPAECVTSTGSSPFHSVPLPWSTVPACTLQSSFGDENFVQLVKYTLQNLSAENIRLLPPSILSNAASEDARLREELERLKSRYQGVIQHRDRAVADIERLAGEEDPRNLLKAVSGLRKLIQRSDRMSRQIFICNDQIRQIEIQGEEHIIGTLRYTLGRGGVPVSGWERPESEPVSETKADLDHIPSPTWLQTGKSECELSKSLSTSRRIHFEPLFEHLRSPTMSESRPASVSTVLSFQLGNLGFPLPPSRAPAEQTSPSTSADSREAQQTPDLTDLAADLLDPAPRRPKGLNKSASTNSIPTLLKQEDSSQEIIIYPPGHRRSESAPLLGAIDLPHTPWLSQPLAPSLPATRPPPLRRVDNNSGPTEPLRLKVSRPKPGEVSRAKSMMIPISGATPPKRSRRGRDTQLETPESILLSLATAEFWTQGFDSAVLERQD
ncbi:hypothetical protein BD324DRAFT_649856 [Kockovaella imperatae]|uniref:Uncharacterized protein n=1 Tax=Kockovaella imperatae TaxID=4999 RepID=A0A1Y1UKG5_9TREE|nr:hypothetical protein BD324DRAFT_649856 [Kockovaella imperatae]ORX38489.1 hypothetical protein BD324DRAFT_649856 [Kockovaella imperatae]